MLSSGYYPPRVSVVCTPRVSFSLSLDRVLPSIHLVVRVVRGSATIETESRLLRQHLTPELLDQMERCKKEYLASHPAIDRSDDGVTGVPRPEPTRRQPARDREQPRRFVFHVSELRPCDSEDMAIEGLRALRQSVRARGNVARLMAISPFSHSLPVHGLRYWAALPG